MYADKKIFVNLRPMNKKKKCIIYFSLCLILFVTACRQSKKTNEEVQSKTQFKENLLKANKGLLSLDEEKIKAYIKRRHWDMKQTQSGMWYELVSTDSAPNDSAKVGKIAHLKYKVSLLDGTLCYSSDSTGLLHFNIGYGGVEFGLEQAILLMKIGDKGRFVMPPHLAHGLLGDENKIPLRTTIVYQIELIDLTN